MDVPVARGLRRRAHDLGLGLYFCRLATEAQGGEIWVEETEALPTVFALRLPRISARAIGAVPLHAVNAAI